MSSAEVTTQFPCIICLLHLISLWCLVNYRVQLQQASAVLTHHLLLHLRWHQKNCWAKWHRKAMTLTGKSYFDLARDTASVKQNAFAANFATRIPEAECIATQLAAQDNMEPDQNARTFAEATRQQDAACQANLQHGFRPTNREPFAAADCEFMKQTCHSSVKTCFTFVFYRFLWKRDQPELFFLPRRKGPTHDHKGLSVNVKKIEKH